ALDGDHVALVLRQISDVLLIDVVGAAIFLARTRLEIEEDGNDADPLGQELDHVDERGVSRARLDVADEATIVRGARWRGEPREACAGSGRNHGTACEKGVR